MIIPPARSNPAKRQTAGSVSVAAPVGGWNARDALDGMDPKDAVLLDNFIPGTDAVRLRNGHTSHATGLGSGAVESLIVHASGSTEVMLGVCDGDIFDASGGGAIGAALATGFSNSRFQECAMGGYTLLFNGADTPQKFDGSVITSNGLTAVGLTSDTALVYPWVFKNRVFMVEKNTLSAWYLPVNAITGTPSELDFSTICQLGGRLVAGGTWTRDGGSGVDDLCVFVTSMGEVLVYQGTDPSDADNWAIVGVFRIGPPVGQRPLLRLGSDLVVISLDGIIPLSKVLPIDRIGAGKVALSDKIRNAVNRATLSYKDYFGWQAIHYPQGTYALVNVPLAENLTSHQYVVNTITGAWCRFTGQEASCWAVFEDRLYFGGQAGKTYLADSGTSDNGANIQADMLPAFNYFGARGRQKRFTLIRPVISTNGDVTFSYVLNLDFADRAPSSVSSGGTIGAEWDVATWDTAEWAADSVIQKRWLSVSGVGYCASPHIRYSGNALELSVNSIDYVFEAGGIL